MKEFWFTTLIVFPVIVFCFCCYLGYSVRYKMVDYNFLRETRYLTYQDGYREGYNQGYTDKEMGKERIR